MAGPGRRPVYPDHGAGCGCVGSAVDPTCLAARAARFEAVEHGLALHLLERTFGTFVLGFAAGMLVQACAWWAGPMVCGALCAAFLGWKTARMPKRRA